MKTVPTAIHSEESHVLWRLCLCLRLSWSDYLSRFRSSFDLIWSDTNDEVCHALPLSVLVVTRTNDGVCWQTWTIIYHPNSLFPDILSTFQRENKFATSMHEAYNSTIMYDSAIATHTPSSPPPFIERTNLPLLCMKQLQL